MGGAGGPVPGSGGGGCSHTVDQTGKGLTTGVRSVRNGSHLCRSKRCIVLMLAVSRENTVNPRLSQILISQIARQRCSRDSAAHLKLFIGIREIEDAALI